MTLLGLYQQRIGFWLNIVSSYKCIGSMESGMLKQCNGKRIYGTVHSLKCLISGNKKMLHFLVSHVEFKMFILN
jgi:hypothetical protein